MTAAAPALSDAARALLDLLSDRTKVVWKASNGRWYVTSKSGQVKAAAVQELHDAGRLIECGGCHSYRRAA